MRRGEGNLTHSGSGWSKTGTRRGTAEEVWGVVVDCNVMNRLKCNRLLRQWEAERRAVKWNQPHLSEYNSERIMRMQKWEYVTIQRAIMANCLLCFSCMKKLSVNANIWARNKFFFFLPACLRVPSSVIPSLSLCKLRQCKCVCMQKKKACKCVFQHVYASVDKYMRFFLVCMKCAGVWVGAGLCKYWCIAVRKAITNSGPRASLYWGRERGVGGGGGRRTDKKEKKTYKTYTHTHAWKALTQSRKSTQADT